MVAGQRAESAAEQPANQLAAHEFQRPGPLLLAAAQERVDDLEQQVFQKLAVLLISPRRHQQLPGAVAAMFDRVEKVRLTRPFIAEHRHHLRVRRRIVTIEIDDAEELLALRGVELGDVVARADFIVRVAGKVVAKWVPGPAKHFRDPVHKRSFGNGGRHDNLHVLTRLAAGLRPARRRGVCHAFAGRSRGRKTDTSHRESTLSLQEPHAFALGAKGILTRPGSAEAWHTCTHVRGSSH